MRIADLGVWMQRFIVASSLALILSASAQAGPAEDCIQHPDPDQMIVGCSEVIAKNPKSAGAYLNRSKAYMSKGDADRTIADASRAIEIDPTSAGAYLNRGAGYARRGEGLFFKRAQ